MSKEREVPELSPQMERSMQATKRVWREMDEEFGLWTIGQTADYLNVGLKDVIKLRDDGYLLAVVHEDEILYPEFQFKDGEINPVITDLIAEAESSGRSESGLALWMVNPTGYLDGKRPVDFLDQPEEVLLAARASFNVEW